MTDYAGHVDPLSVRKLAVQIVVAAQEPWPPCPQKWHHPAAIFDHVKQHVQYVPDPVGVEYVAPPAETVECGGGDCDDQAVLVASLCEAVGFPTRIVLCESGRREGHMLAEVDYGQADVDDVVAHLERFYGGRCDVRGGFFGELSPTGSFWILADTVLGEYLGDIAGLERTGCVALDRETRRWGWAHAARHYARKR